jgi:hypothetical protein
MTAWKSGSLSVWPLSIYHRILQEVEMVRMIVRGSRADLVVWAIAARKPFFPRLAKGGLLFLQYPNTFS